MEPEPPNTSPERTLAQELARGPLSIFAALRYAIGIAASLRVIHAEGGAHGAVCPAAVHLGPEGAVLSSPNGHARQAQQHGDVAAFGALLLEMLTGRQPAGVPGIPAAPRPALHCVPEDLRVLATRLACRCRGDEVLTMQRVLTELRVLGLLARQVENKMAMRQRAFAAAGENREASVPTAQHQDVPGQAKETPEPKARCPRCGSLDIHDSKARTGLEILLVRLGKPILRCHRCQFRYFYLLGTVVAKDAGAE